MNKRVKRLGVFAVIIGLGVLVHLWAEVKLRIYLKDGSLQAGNLVSENKDQFVILSKEGRVEVPKSKIMFINGKSLRQWEEQPEKDYQTEIMPSDVPDAAYVTTRGRQKTPIQPYSSIQNPIPEGKQVDRSPPVDPSPASDLLGDSIDADAAADEFPSLLGDEIYGEPSDTPGKKLSRAEKKKIKKAQKVKRSENSARAVPAEKSPPIESVQASAKPVVGVVPLTPMKSQAPVLAPPKKKNPPITKTPVVAKKAEKKVLVKSAPVKNSHSRPKGFVRSAMAQYHYERAQKEIENGQRGMAIQELHYATILDRASPDMKALMGKLYLEEKVFSQAEKYLTHPLIVKKEETQMLLKSLDRQRNHQKFGPYYLSGGAAGGFLLGSFSILYGLRRIRKKPARVFTSDNADEIGDLVKARVAEEMESAELKQIEPEIREQTEISTEPLKQILSEVEKLDAAPQHIPLSLEESLSQLEKIDEKEIPVPPEPVPEEITAEPQKDIPVEEKEDSKKEEQEISPPPPELEVLLPHPVVENHRTTILRSHMKEMALERGNQWAVEGQLDKARREYRTAMLLDENCTEGFIGMGYLCFMQGQWELSLHYYQQAALVSPQSADAHYGVGRVLMETGHPQEAQGELRRALELDPSLDDARDTLSYLGKAA